MSANVLHLQSPSAEQVAFAKEDDDEDTHHGWVRRQPGWLIGIALLHTEPAQQPDFTIGWTVRPLFSRDLQEPSIKSSVVDDKLGAERTRPGPPDSTADALWELVADGGDSMEGLHHMMKEVTKGTGLDFANHISQDSVTDNNRTAVLDGCLDGQSGYLIFSLSVLEAAAADKYSRDTELAADKALWVSKHLLKQLHDADHVILREQFRVKQQEDNPSAGEEAVSQRVEEAMNGEMRQNCIAIAVDEQMRNVYVAVNYKTHRLTGISSTHEDDPYEEQQHTLVQKGSKPAEMAIKRKHMQFGGYGISFADHSIIFEGEAYDFIAGRSRVHIPKDVFRSTTPEFTPLAIHLIEAVAIRVTEADAVKTEATPAALQREGKLLINDPLYIAQTEDNNLQQQLFNASEPEHLAKVDQQKHLKNRRLNGKAHAEMTLLAHAAQNSISLRAMAISKPACNLCAEVFKKDRFLNLVIRTDGSKAMSHLDRQSWADTSEIKTEEAELIPAQTADSIPTELNAELEALGGFGNPIGFFGSRHFLADRVRDTFGSAGSILSKLL